jgi:hypothetical protein
MSQLRMTMLHIDLATYGINEGKYEGRVAFIGQYGTTQIILSPTLSQRVLELCADALVKNTKTLAESISAEVIAQTDNLLPSAV